MLNKNTMETDMRHLVKYCKSRTQYAVIRAVITFVIVFVCVTAIFVMTGMNSIATTVAAIMLSTVVGLMSYGENIRKVWEPVHVKSIALKNAREMHYFVMTYRKVANAEKTEAKKIMLDYMNSANRELKYRTFLTGVFVARFRRALKDDELYKYFKSL